MEKSKFDKIPNNHSNYVIMFDNEQKKYWLASRYYANGNLINQQVGNSSCYKKVIEKLQKKYCLLNKCHEFGINIKSGEVSDIIIHFQTKENFIVTNDYRKENYIKYLPIMGFYFEINDDWFGLEENLLIEMGFNTKNIIKQYNKGE